MTVEISPPSSGGSPRTKSFETHNDSQIDQTFSGAIGVDSHIECDDTSTVRSALHVSALTGDNTCDLVPLDSTAFISDSDIPDNVSRQEPLHLQKNDHHSLNNSSEDDKKDQVRNSDVKEGVSQSTALTEKRKPLHLHLLNPESSSTDANDTSHNVRIVSLSTVGDDDLNSSVRFVSPDSPSNNLSHSDVERPNIPLNLKIQSQSTQNIPHHEKSLSDESSQPLNDKSANTNPDESSPSQSNSEDNEYMNSTRLKNILQSSSTNKLLPVERTSTMKEQIQITHTHEKTSTRSSIPNSCQAIVSDVSPEPSEGVLETMTDNNHAQQQSHSSSPKEKQHQTVSSAIDDVLSEIKEEKTATMNTSLEKVKMKKIPCILQQSLIVDEANTSSGTSTPSEYSTNVEMSKGPAPLRVESSMLVPEDSLNLIAQMSIQVTSSACKQTSLNHNSEKKSTSVSFGVNTVIETNTSVSEEATTITPSIRKISPIKNDIPSTLVASSTSNKSSSSPSSYNEPKRKTTPIISGSAAEQIEISKQRLNNANRLLDHNNENASSPDKSEQFASYLNPFVKSSPQTNPFSRPKQLNQPNLLHENQQSEGKEPCGMDMLANIIAHASPIPVPPSKTHASRLDVGREGSESCSPQKSQTSCDPNNSLNVKKITPHPNSSVPPVGQSLSVFSAIAAEAGVPKYPVTSEDSQSNTVTTPSTSMHPPQQAPLPPTTTESTSTTTPHSKNIEILECVRKIGKIRRFNATLGRFSEWEDLPCKALGGPPPKRWNSLNIDESIEIPLRRGGRLRVFPDFLEDPRMSNICQSMEYCKHYYDVADDGYERDSRVHVSLSSRVAGDASFPMSNKLGDPEYMYRAVNSASALPLSLFPPVHGLAQNLAELYRLPNNEWNIGVDLVCYRDGDDHIGWHADDKQGEALVLSIVVDSKTVIRPVLVKPKTDNLGFRDGDEEIILFITEGDAYEMDGQMQMYYEHSVPKKSGDPSASRSVVVFRHGRATVVDSDSSLEYEIENSSDNVGVVPVINSNEPNQSKQSNLHFGHVTGILEAKRFYTREDLETAGAHIHQVKCINGSIRDGCDSLLLNSQASNLREDDGLIWFQITSCRSEGGGALCRNYHRNLPVRVFRSSELNNKYAPHVRENGKAMYRYDGLYTVCAMWDKDGNETDIYPPLNGAQHTFFLTRLPKKPLDIMIEKGLYYNRVGLQELWSEIQKKRGARKPRMFEIPEPLMKLPAIDGNVDRVDKVKPSSNDGSVIKKAKRGRKPKKAKIEADSNKEPQTEAPKDDKADILVEDTVSATKVDVEDSDSSAVSRSKRASAVAARTYLKEVMQNRYGDTEPEESLPSKKSAITPSGHDDEDECDDTQPNKRLKKTSDSENDVCPSPDENVRGDICDRNENKDNEDLVDRTVELKELETKDDEMSVDGNDHVSIADSHQKNDDDSNSQISEKDIEDTKSHDNSSEITDSSNSDAKNISEGARIHVEYKNTLFKATVRKTRKKGKVTQYLIHYDGNKKSNVHWIHHSKVHEILSTSLDEDFITNMEIQKPKRGRKRKSSTAIDDSDDNMKGNKASDKVDDVEDYQFKFSEGADIYAEYKEVLYLATIRSSRVNKKGIPEYFIHYHGFKRTSDRFVPEVNVLEINPTTTRRFNKMRADAQNNEFKDLQNESVGENELSTETSSVAKTTRKKNSGAELNSTLDMGDLIPGVEFLPGSSVFVVFKNALYLAKMVKRRKRGKETDYKVHFAGIQDAEDEWVPLSTIYEINPHSRRIFEKTANVRKENDEESNAASGADRVTGPNSKKRKEDNEQNTGKDSKVATSKSSQSSNGIDLSGVTSGVDFLPGSTVFVNWKKGLYLGKMLKRRGKGDYMEYLIHYDGYKKSFDDWVSVDSVYEINAQTKRIYGRQNK